MDFIDDFIKEYRDNPCLWKANSIYFKDRTKRQEAYSKLIDVAARHGEHYNIERTKQKINNLRCAFRHQLKRYAEFKTKTGRDEPYCPKRRYFESLMFLIQEENQADGTKYGGRIQEITFLENKYVPEESPNEISADKSHPFSELEILSDPKEQNKIVLCLKDKKKKNEDLNMSGSEYRTELHRSKRTTDHLAEDQVNTSTIGQTLRDAGIKGPEKLCYVQQKSNDFQSNSFHIQQSINANEECEEKKNLNRSDSVSSLISNESDAFPAKYLKVACTSKDFQKLLTLACVNIDKSLEDNFSNFGKSVAQKLRSLSPQQAIFAEKLISDVLFQGHLGLLSASNVENFSLSQ